jgi:hypothetical protein
MPSLYSHRVKSAVLVLNLQDEFARIQVGKGFPRPIEPLSFYLVGTYQGGNLEEFLAPVRLFIQTNSGGYHLFFGEERVDKDTKRNLFLQDGDYQLRVESPYYQSAEKQVHIPMGDVNFPPSGGQDPMIGYTIRLQPGPAYPFPDAAPFRVAPGAGCSDPPTGGKRGPTLLRGSLHKFDGTPIEKAVVTVTGTTVSGESGQSGDWILWFSDRQATGPVTVHIQLPGPGAAAFDLTSVCVVSGRELSLAQTSLRGWVTRQGAGIDAVKIDISGQPQPVRTSSTGEWRFYFPLNFAGGAVSVTATLPDGTKASQQVQSVERASVLVPTFRF